MQAVVLFLALGLLLVLVVFPIWAIVRINALERARQALRNEVLQLETAIRDLRATVAALARRPADPLVPPPAAPVLSALVASAATATPPAEPMVQVAPAPPAMAREAVSPPTVSNLPQPVPAAPPPLSPVARSLPPTQPSSPRPAEPPRQELAPATRIDWEQFMGAKLFAWLGGLAGLLAVGFFVKYSFEHELIPPEVRVAIGFLVALGLIVGGLKIDRTRYAVTSQTLIATGIVSLYTVTFACRSVYHFGFFGAIPTFLLMALITGTAFLLAVRLEAQVVAILGILGGFLTPVLVSTGEYNPVGLFGYIALLDVGLMAVALHRRWFYLVPLGATGTIVMQVAWAGNYFSAERADTAAFVWLVFAVLFLGPTLIARRRGREDPVLTWSAVALACVGYGFGLFFIGHPSVGARLGLVFSLVLAANLCLLTLAWFEGMAALVGLAAAGTALLLVNWRSEIVTAVNAPAAMGVCLGFCVFFLATHFLARRWGRAAPEIAWSAVALPFVAFLFAFSFLGQAEISSRPGWLLTFVLLADLCLLAIAWFEDEWPKLHLVAGAVVFVLLASWTGTRLTAPLLSWALAFYLLYAVLHTAFPLVLERRHTAVVPTWWSQLVPPLTLLLLLIPLFKLEELSLLFWPCVLLVDLLAIGLALFTASLVAVGAVLVLTLVVTGVWIFQLPAAMGAAPSLLLVVGGFAVLFFVAGLFLVRRLGDQLAPAGTPTWLPVTFGDPRAQIPVLSALLPFVLLIMMTARLALPDPSAVFGLALLLIGLVLGLTVILMGSAPAPDAGVSGETSDGGSGAPTGLGWLPACALAGVAGLEYSWRARHFAVDRATIPLLWYLAFYAIFAVYPFVFRRRFAAYSGPWIAAALGGMLQFPLVYRLIAAAWPNEIPGVLPALFAVAPLLSLVAILRSSVADERTRLNQLAWFGGVALLFISLVFPIQFERQWLTLGWAFEGAALLWLFHRVPHPGLRFVGAALLVTAFARLALNPAVFGYHARSSTAIFNWYLYSYGLVTACLFVGAFLVKPPRDRLPGRIDGPALFNTLGTILAFFLLNIEIADFFSEAGQRVLAFKFSGHFGRDMTYTIAWSLFALGLLLVSIWKHVRAGRWAALALLSVAVIKLFFHDLARLGALHRIGALFAVAVIATLASFAYQRFLPANEKNAPPK